ncbi:cobalamin trafficking protein CblD [Drosophila sulfurigaster albostrigata]|uniref:Cobalamin trafficking protein CblD n=1 Tax=Drosophila albomicans TaxID=7291 RepID=A0A6P8XS54_DROAB|nr:cobalamin trafficking protein CblD [Drosophila albomicans]XP_060662715.1 cobalamin trafficking protein CblD [Drosophila nasuta]XP_062141408.1 cobalamin trafficking protein CblD [Drosophila sulfurigaster albostrigata]
MSRTLSRLFGRCLISNAHAKPLQDNTMRTVLSVKPIQIACSSIVFYSKRNGPPSDAGESFKTVTKSRRVDNDDTNILEGEPNWELTSKRHNRFYLPNAIGPAWQGDTSTVGLMEPLAQLVNFFKDDNVDRSRLEFSCCQCPTLIRDSIFELFPVRAIGQRDYAITLLTLSYEGDIEQGAAKFVLAAREISDRLMSLGYWSDFLNPFSGRPYFLPRDASILYKQDSRFRGVNMRLSNYNDCVLIAPEENDKTCFSGTIFCTAPNNYPMLVELLAPTEFQMRVAPDPE